LAGKPTEGPKLGLPAWAEYVLRHAPCFVCVAMPPTIPHEVVGQPPGPPSGGPLPPPGGVR
jgi:hypothetical protein